MSSNSATGLHRSAVPGVAPEPPYVHGDDRARPTAVEPPARAQTGRAPESRRARVRRKAHRGRLHLYVVGAVVLLAYVVALAASNTGPVKIDWVFGTSSVALVWLVLFSLILGWVLGTLITVLFRWRTRAPRPS